MGDRLGSPRVAPLFLVWERPFQSHQNSAVKCAWVRVVLGWVTSWEVLVLHPYFWFGNGRFSDIALVGAAYKDRVMYGSSKFVTQEMTGAIIPALVHRIPSNSAVKRAWTRVVLGWVSSWEVLVLHPYFRFGNGRSSDIALMHRIPVELRSEACLSESSTRMGDLLGSPRVAPLFLVWERPFQYHRKFVTQEMTGAIIPALMHWIPSELCTLVGAAYKDGVMYGSSKFVTQEMTGAIIPALVHQIPSELRTLVGAAYKDGVMYGSSKFVTQEMTGAIIPALMRWIPLELRTLVGAAYKDGVMYGSSKFVTQEMTGAIIPALMHRIPSELRS
ncbi:hypothetical protein V6N12_046596 [Hibiscus sabdariffa]|uniref:Uncharacterized protein n=1 Tax=Hibiscus sabdariffa TaxID=183260 RepID=A0ABR2DJI9_9ROSI